MVCFKPMMILMQSQERERRVAKKKEKEKRKERRKKKESQAYLHEHGNRITAFESRIGEQACHELWTGIASPGNLER